jgi:hypothetical protein
MMSNDVPERTHSWCAVQRANGRGPGGRRSLILGFAGSPTGRHSQLGSQLIRSCSLSWLRTPRHDARTRVWHAQSALERQGARATRNLDTERRRRARVPPSVAETSSCQGACHRKYTVLDSNLCIAASSSGPSPAVASARVRAMADYPTGVVLGCRPLPRVGDGPRGGQVSRAPGVSCSCSVRLQEFSELLE